MQPNSTVRKFRLDGETRSLPTGQEAKPMESLDTKRLNVNLPRSVFDELEGIAKRSGRSITEVVRMGLGVVTLMINEENNHNRFLIVDPDGKPIKELVLPR